MGGGFLLWVYFLKLIILDRTASVNSYDFPEVLLSLAIESQDKQERCLFHTLSMKEIVKKGMWHCY